MKEKIKTLIESNQDVSSLLEAGKNWKVQVKDKATAVRMSKGMEKKGISSAWDSEGNISVSMDSKERVISYLKHFKVDYKEV